MSDRGYASARLLQMLWCREIMSENVVVPIAWESIVATCRRWKEEHEVIKTCASLYSKQAINLLCGKKQSFQRSTWLIMRQCNIIHTHTTCAAVDVQLIKVFVQMYTSCTCKVGAHCRRVVASDLALTHQPFFQQLDVPICDRACCTGWGFGGRWCI